MTYLDLRYGDDVGGAGCQVHLLDIHVRVVRYQQEVLLDRFWGKKRSVRVIGNGCGRFQRQIEKSNPILNCHAKGINMFKKGTYLYHEQV